MKWTAFCEYPADDRGVYVEALSEEDARRKIVAAVTLVYDCAPADVIIYNLVSEAERPERIQGEVAWNNDGPIRWDYNPLVLYREPA